jgi:hypothetical protein
MPVPSPRALPAACMADRVSIPVPPTASTAAGLPRLLGPSGELAKMEAAA